QAELFRDHILGDTYHYFLDLVAKQRHMTPQQVDVLAQGRVWTGDQAVQNKLIDQIGGFDAALAQAKRMAKLDPRQSVAIVELPEQASALTRLLSGKIYGQEWRPPRALAPLISALNEALAREGALGQAYCPIMPRM